MRLERSTALAHAGAQRRGRLALQPGAWLVLAAATLPSPAFAAPARPAGAPRCAAPTASPLTRRPADSARPAALEAGAAGDLVVRELLRAACTAPHARWLPASCAPFEGGGLAELHSRLALDLGRAPSTLLSRSGSGTPPEQRSALLAASALVDVALASPSVEGLAWRLARAPEGAAEFAADPCSDRARISSADPVAVAAALLEVLLALPSGAQPADAEAAIARALANARVTGNAEALDPARRALVPALRRAFTDAQAQRAAPAERLPALVRAYARLVAAALSVVEGRPADTDVTLAPRLVDPLARGDLRGATAAALGLVRALAPDSLPESLAVVVEVMSAVAQAPDEDAARAALVRLLVPLGPWAEHVLFDANLGAVRLDDRDFTFAGDALLGYQGEALGIIARGALYEYDFTSDQRIVQTTHAEGGLDAWWVSSGSAWRFELRGEGGVSLLDTTRIGLAPGDTPFADETSLLGRGLLLAALRWQPSGDAAAGLWLGGGAQYEDYTPLAVPRGGVVTLASETSLTAIAQARLRVQLALVPRWVGLRLRADVLRYEVRRDRELFVVGPGAVTSSATSEQTVQLEAHGRVFLDAEVARLAGFVPGVFGGVDHYSVDAPSAGATSATAPVFGGGIRRVTF
ncbi:MAG: hypothetical protein IT376_02115 [Polyangiaceae bacterium]|nr:hypothetical protein [Polyangiaceae bacterium]